MIALENCLGSGLAGEEGLSGSSLGGDLDEEGQMMGASFYVKGNR